MVGVHENFHNGHLSGLGDGVEFSKPDHGELAKQPLDSYTMEVLQHLLSHNCTLPMEVLVTK